MKKRESSKLRLGIQRYTNRAVHPTSTSVFGSPIHSDRFKAMEANQQAGVEMVSDGVFDKEAVFSAVQNNKIV